MMRVYIVKLVTCDQNDVIGCFSSLKLATAHAEKLIEEGLEMNIEDFKLSENFFNTDRELVNEDEATTILIENYELDKGDI